ncbi:hypothetical protein HPB49_010341 [Dermacentor silvarum]|uniref:Uncharacterized protein n=1 Tax=Dermacentor silvarum TaxID=543639 RepID=A0ACB8CWU6_DERSI|nr:hypothetical protein HPB49_010341 [Dermacentor silvarum]
MRIREKLIYNKQRDAFVGDVDMGPELQDIGPSSEDEILANSLLCFLLCGLHVRFKIPVGYFFTKGCTGEQLAVVVRHVLKKTTDIGFDIVRLVTDNHKVNVAAMDILCGGKASIQASHPADPSKKIFLSFDQSHIIKNVRSQFLSKDFGKEKQITSKYVKSLYKMQKNSTVRPVRFLTRKHLYPTNIEKMNVRNESAAGSFLSKETYHALIFATTSNVQCIRHLLTVKKFEFVLTRKMSSDPIESMFGFLRRSSGSNDILDVKSAICGLEKMLKTGIVAASDQSNVQSSTSFAARQLLPIQHSHTMPATGNKFIDQAVNDLKNHCTTLTPRITGPHEASVAMVGGFIVRAATESIVCSNCIALLQGQKGNTPLLGLIVHQDRGGLFYPSQELVKLLIGLRKLVDSVLPHRKYFTKPLERDESREEERDETGGQHEAGGEYVEGLLVEEVPERGHLAVRAQEQLRLGRQLVTVRLGHGPPDGPPPAALPGSSGGRTEPPLDDRPLQTFDC